MTSQFDATTKAKAEEFVGAPSRPHQLLPDYRVEFEAYRAGRESCKESLAILVRALERFSPFAHHGPKDYAERVNALAQVKANGDYPLTEKTKETE